jgi:hypothetical protein
MIWIPFPSESVSIVYERPRPHWPRTRAQYRIEVKHDRVSRVVELDGVPALEVRENVDDHNPGRIDFAVDGTRVTLWGYRRSASLEAIARSMVERAK